MTALPAETDTALHDSIIIEKVKAGDHEAYRLIVDRYWDRIYARVFNLLKNRQDAEEVTQDAFMRAHRGLENFRGEASFSTWLFQIATNLAHNRYWYWWRRKRDQSVSLDMNLSDESNATLVDVLPSEEADPSDNTITEELVQRVEDCLPMLSAKHQEILELRIKKDFSYEEIAQKLKISVGTVKSRIARARDSLRHKMGTDF